MEIRLQDTPAACAAMAAWLRARLPVRTERGPFDNHGGDRRVRYILHVDIPVDSPAGADASLDPSPRRPHQRQEPVR